MVNKPSVLANLCPIQSYTKISSSFLWIVEHIWFYLEPYLIGNPLLWGFSGVLVFHLMLGLVSEYSSHVLVMCSSKQSHN